MFLIICYELLIYQFDETDNNLRIRDTNGYFSVKLSPELTTNITGK